jgi:hypothetical protein
MMAARTAELLDQQRPQKKTEISLHVLTCNPPSDAGGSTLSEQVDV